ncbi:hypothetical protein [Apis mellifera associated microvirus 34]|nr:hypothetical protein [Apis mellifera associated microvirus 34]
MSPGLVIKEKDQVVPDQSMSLREILTRFVRREALPVSKATFYGSETGIDPDSESHFNVDQEKAQYWDFTEKADFKEKVDNAKRELEQYESAKKKRAEAKKAEAEKAEFERKVEEAAARRAAQKGTTEGGSI